MPPRLFIRHADRSISEYAIARDARLGGAASDEIQAPELPPSALLLRPALDGIVLIPRATPLRVNRRVIEVGNRRLLRPNECAELYTISLRVEIAPAPEATRALAGALLAGNSPPFGPHFLVIEGLDAGLNLPIHHHAVLGRGRAAHHRLRDPFASRAHAHITAQPIGTTIRELGSKNGMTINARTLRQKEAPLRPGDTLVIGRSMLVYRSRAHHRGEITPREVAPRLPRTARIASATLLALAFGLALAAAATTR